MKPLKHWNNEEKAELLHQLFPDQIRRFVSYVEETANVIISAPERVKDQWGSKTISAEVWIKLAKEINEIIVHSKDRLVANSDHFASQLFQAYKGIFLIQCLQDYITICPNSKFNKAIELLFDV
jgi:hypothetical protein